MRGGNDNSNGRSRRPPVRKDDVHPENRAALVADSDFQVFKDPKKNVKRPKKFKTKRPGGQ